MVNEQTRGVGRRIVVGVDGTEGGDRALRYALEYTRGDGSALTLVHVVQEPPTTAPLLPMFDTVRLEVVGNAVLDDAEELVRQLSGGGLRPEKILARGPRAEALIGAAGTSPIVLGSRGPDARPPSAGFTTTAVAAHALGTVFCVPARWQPQVVHGTVLVGVDGRAGSRDVLAAAFDAAAERGARLTVLHAWRPTGRYAATLGAPAAESWELQTEPVIWELVAALRGDHPQVDVQVVLRFERPDIALQQESREADLVVVGRRSDEPKLALALGPTARAMLLGACPVEVAPFPGERPLPAQRGVADSRRRTDPLSARRR